MPPGQYRCRAGCDEQDGGGDSSEGGLATSRSLLDAARACEGFSGRMLRKLPFLAHAGESCLMTDTIFC